ncbi:MAG: PDZ domain-containing protein [Gammaproteobacteria bacterium]|nr:PDZ domain-containing protein [Gammaproteobacteria bacterium]
MLAAFTIILTMQSVLAAEQSATGPVHVAGDSQEYFLLQSFHASSPQQFNHLGLIAQPGVGGYRVSAVLDGFPAQQAGLRRGDLLVSIDGRPFHPVLSLNPQIGDGRVPIALDREVELEYNRNGSATTLSLQPVYGSLFDAYRTATLNSVQQFSNGNKLIGYVKLWSLDRSTNGIQGFHQLLDSLSHCDGLVLDLRDSYGFINANHIDRFFSSRNSLFELSGAHDDLWQQQQPERLPMRAYGRAMTVIQNDGTRGGLELFAYQLASLQRVVSIGETTSGKAGQVSFNRSRGLLTYLPRPEVLIDGQQLEAAGIAAEVPTPYPLDESLPVDPQLDAAVLALMEII